jgi:phosphoribosylformylglycinamidine synthase I
MQPRYGIAKTRVVLHLRLSGVHLSEAESMPSPRACVLRAPGTNCDPETAFAFEQAGAEADRVHLFRLLEDPSLLAGYQILCVPGGFSYGDDLAAGVVFSRQLRGVLNDAIREFLTADKLVLGICNGFQTILKAGLLLRRGIETDEGNAWEHDVTLTWNQNGRYTDRWVRLKVTSSNSVFLKGIDEIEVPMAHAEGRIAFSSPDVLETLRQQDSVALCYWSDQADQLAEAAGDPTRIDVLPEPDNPNGSTANIAGLCDSTGRVLGLMPHPERFLFATQHPQWTRRRMTGEGAGAKIFQNAVAYFQ